MPSVTARLCRLKVKQEQIVTCRRTFSPASGPHQAFAWSFEWFTGSLLSSVIVQVSFFGFGVVLRNTIEKRLPRQWSQNHLCSFYMYHRLTCILWSFSAWSRTRPGQCLVSVISINWLWAYSGSFTGAVRLSLGSQHACYCWRRREREMAGLWLLLRWNGNFCCTNRWQCWKVHCTFHQTVRTVCFFTFWQDLVAHIIWKRAKIIKNSPFAMLQFKSFDALYF